jgi:integrase
MFKSGKRWYSDFVYQGERYTKAWGAISKTVAAEKDRKYRTDVLEGKVALKAKRILFETFAEKYLEAARVNKKPQAARRNEASIKMLKSHFEGKLISSIHSFQVEQYKADRKKPVWISDIWFEGKHHRKSWGDETPEKVSEKHREFLHAVAGAKPAKAKLSKAPGAAPATINRDVATLRNMMNKAVEWGYLPQNPLLSVRLFKEENERMWVLTPEEEKKLLLACQSSPQERKYLSDLVLFALNSGMRLKEILGLRKDQVDLGGRVILVTDTKNGEARKVPVNDTLKAIVERQAKGNTSEWVFCSAAGERLTVLTNAFWKAVKDAGLIRNEVKDGKVIRVRLRFHDLRHSFGSRLGMAGVDLKTIMEIMGHKSHRVAMRYQHPGTDHKLSAVKILDQLPSIFTTSNVLTLKKVGNSNG